MTLKFWYIFTILRCKKARVFSAVSKFLTKCSQQLNSLSSSSVWFRLGSDSVGRSLALRIWSLARSSSMSRMTVRATAREMQTTPRVEETFTGWAKLVNISWWNGNVLTRIIPNLNLLILQIFIVNFTENMNQINFYALVKIPSIFCYKKWKTRKLILWTIYY